LRFERSYNAGAADLYTTTLGYGWSHNYEVNLVFSDTVGGEPNTVIAQGCHGSRFRFQDDWDDDGGYDPFPGVWATLTRTLETSPTYFLRGVDQSTYVFTSTGQLTEIRDPQGHAVTLVYSDTQLLARVQDATGERYLGFKYDDSDRLIEVRDPINRRVRYGYEGGDLVVVTDTLTNTWTYAGLFNSK
jgi:YD repeat-containing protein